MPELDPIESGLDPLNETNGLDSLGGSGSGPDPRLPHSSSMPIGPPVALLPNMNLDALVQESAASIAVKTSGSAQEAQKALRISRDFGIDPLTSPEAQKALEDRQKDETLQYKLNQLPRLREYMLRSPFHAAAIQDEIDQWGTLDYIFGRYQSDPHAMERAQALAAGQPYRADQGRYEPPGWTLALGRAMYSTATSMQTMALMAWGKGRTPEEIKALRDVTDAPVPGDNKPVLSTVNSLIGMTPIIGAALVHPAAAFGMMYAESSGRAYEQMRTDGYDHESAKSIANLIGFTNATIGSAMGPMFHGEALAIPVKGSLVGLSNAMLVSMTKSPSLWRGLLGLGTNFAANLSMNITMASNEAAIQEAFDSAKEGRPFSASRVASSASMAAEAWAEMAALSIEPAYRQHAERKAMYPTGQAVKDAMAFDARAKMAEQIYQNYEMRGQALRSIHEASQIVAAVDAIKDSPFMKANPEDARDLIQKMVEPRASQTVYIKPEILQKLSADKLAQLGNPDISLGQSGANVPVNLVNFLMHPDAEAMTPHMAAWPDLLTLGEAHRVDLTQDQMLNRLATKFKATGPDPDTAVLALVFKTLKNQGLSSDEIAGRVNRGLSPTDVDRIIDTNFNSANTDSALGVAHEQTRRPPPELPEGVKLERKVPDAPQTREALKGWAEDAVARVPTAELMGIASQHESLWDEHSQRALTAQEVATAHAEQGRPEQAEIAKQKAKDSKRVANVSEAMHKAASKADKEVELIGNGLAEAASQPLDGQPSGREKAWMAGQVYGEAFDAITENLGLADRVRGYAAPDLSDISDHLLSRGFVAHGQGFDLEMLNRKLVAGPNDIKDLSLLELREYNKALKQIASAVDSENTIRYEGIRVAKGMIFNEITETLKKLPDKPPGQRMYSDAEQERQKAGQTKAGLASMFNQPHTLMFKLGKIGDDLWFERFVPGVARENHIWGDLHPQLKSIHESLPADVRKAGDDVVPSMSGAPERWGIRKRSDVWHLAMHLGVEGADGKIAQGLGIETSALHEWVHAHLGRTPEEAHLVMERLIEPHWKLFDGIWSEYEREFKERGIAPPEKLKGQKLMIWGKEYSGGYGGRLQWSDPTDSRKPILHPGSLEALLDNGPGQVATYRPHLTERDPNASGMPYLNWNGVADSMRKEVHDIALRGFVEDAHKIFSDGEIRGLIGDKLGKQALSEIYDPNSQTDWLHTVARGSVSDIATAQWFTRSVMKLQGLAAYSAFSLNAKVMLGQFSHLIAAMPGLEINPVHMTAGTAAAFNPYRRAWAHSESEVLRLRWEDYQSRAEELNRQMTGVKPGSDAIRSVTDHANWAAWREMDGFLSHALWESAYAKATMKYQIGGEAPMNHDQAVRFADKAVTKMMPAQDIYDQSAFVRDRSMAGMGFMVRNFPNTLLNVAAMAWWETKVSGGGIAGAAKVSAQYVGMVMAAELLGKGYLMHLGPKDKEDNEEWLRERAVEGLFYPVMLSAPALAGYHALTGQRGKVKDDMSRMMPPSIAIVQQGISDIGTMVEQGDEDAGLRAASHLLGLAVKSPIPGKIFDQYNAARNNEGALDAAKKGLGYRQ